MMSEEKKSKAAVYELIVSFIIPLIGNIYYFTSRKSIANVRAYLYAALSGVALQLIVEGIAKLYAI